MLEERAVRHAVEIHAKSYRLLRWLESAIERGFIAFDAAHTYTSFPEAAQAWLEEHYLNVPADARPAREHLADFCAFFATYLEGSFDLVENPGRRLYSPAAHCFCPMCSWLVDIPRLQPKKISAHDKKRTLKLQHDYLEGVALQLDTVLSAHDVEKLLGDPSLREPLGLATYGEDLLRRLRGKSNGAATLVLWRRFAWVPEGSPKKKFELSAEAILN